MENNNATHIQDETLSTAMRFAQTVNDDDIVHVDDEPLLDLNIRNIGYMSRLSDGETAALVQRLPDKIRNAYPTDRSAYRLGKFLAIFPMDPAPIDLEDCDWVAVTDAATGEPLSLVPNVWAGEMAKLRTFFRLTPTPPIVFFHEDTIFWDEPKYSYEIDLGWFPLTTD